VVVVEDSGGGSAPRVVFDVMAVSYHDNSKHLLPALPSFHIFLSEAGVILSIHPSIHPSIPLFLYLERQKTRSLSRQQVGYTRLYKPPPRKSTLANSRSDGRLLLWMRRKEGKRGEEDWVG